MSKTVFKVGDKVYCVIYGWGKVTDISAEMSFPIEVTFGVDGVERRYYTLDGKHDYKSQPTRSFTEYTFNGFSQERPIELPEVGEEIMVSNDGEHWVIGKFREYVKRSDHPIETAIYGDKYNYKYFKRLR